jgi:ATP-binding cassette subfamily B protein/subfamily B ATP-binding cassette protein MsbA
VIAWSRSFTPHVRAHAWRLAGLMALGCVTVALEALLPWPLKLIVDHVLTGAPLPESVAMLATLPGGDRAEGLLAWLALGLILTFVAAQAIKVVQSVAQTRVGARLQYALAAEVFAKLHALSLVAHGRSRAGDLVRRVTNDTACLPGFVTSVALPVLTSCLSLVVLFAIMWQLDPMLAIVAGVAAVPMGLLMRVLGPRMSDRAYEHQQVEGQVWSVAEQTLTALPLVQAFGRERHEHSRFRSTAERSVGAAVRALVSQIQFKVGVDGSLAVGTAAIMLVGGVQALDGELSVGTLIVFVSYLTALYAPLLAFAYLGPTLATAAGSARRVDELLRHGAVIAEKPGAKALEPGQAGAHLRFEQVVFGYSPGAPVLHGIDFEARPGETVAIVGATGAGKSTLAAMVARLIDPWEGRVLIDGQDIRDATIASVRRATALVLQETFLLPLTIAENIAYGRPDATRVEIEAAARSANAHDFIARLDQGYDAVVGERGLTLSAGQRQRLSIARALLTDAPLLVMDEPTSALDAASEHEVLHALERLKRGRTCVVIAHRLSTVRRAHRIVVLEHGRVCEVGTHAELLSRGRVYRSLHLAHAGEDDAIRARA